MRLLLVIPLLLSSCVFISEDDHAARVGGDANPDTVDGADGADGVADGADGAADGADGAADGADGTADGGDATTDGADGTTDGADGTSDSPWAGDYTGTIEMSFPGRVLGFNTCDGDLSATIDADGDILGAWQCGTGSDPDAITGTVRGQVVGNEALGPLSFDGDLSDEGSWEGFVIDANGGTLTGEFEGTAVEASVGNQAYNGSFDATR